MDIGLGLPQIGPFAFPDVLRTVATTAERDGYSSLWTHDRILSTIGSRAVKATGPVRSLPAQEGTLDPLVALTAAAAVTESIRLGTSALITPAYSPVLLARAAASLDRLSDGRFTLGLGADGTVEEYRAVGVPLHDHHVRIEEMLEVMSRTWRDDVVEIETTHEVVVPSVIGLKPVRGPRVPFLLTASTPAGLDRIARCADGWISRGAPASVAAARWAHVRELAERCGRDPDQLRMVVCAEVTITGSTADDADRRPFSGSVAQIRGDLARFAECGADEVVLDLQRTTASGSELLEVARTLTDDLAEGAA